MTKFEAMQQLNHSGLQLTTSTSSVSEDGYISVHFRDVAGAQASIIGLEVVQTNLATYRRHQRFLDCPVHGIYS